MEKNEDNLADRSHFKHIVSFQCILSTANIPTYNSYSSLVFLKVSVSDLFFFP